MDVTIKPIYGHQEGAEIGYNPHQPGRPCHAYHTLFLRTLRLALDVEVHPGKEHSPHYGLVNTWRVLDRLTPKQRPWLLCGDSAYGNEQMMQECEQRQQAYLFRQRQTKGVKTVIAMLERQGGWQPLADGREACEGSLCLMGWTCKRRIVVVRRACASAATAAHLPLLGEAVAELVNATPYEYHVLVTSLKESVSAIVDLSRQRADMENAYDELKNQWGWGGFMTKDLLRCQVAARTVALIYNWWSLFVRCAEPKRGREAITSRPLLLCAVGRLTRSGGQTTLVLTSNHAEAAHVQKILTQLSLFLSGLRNTAQQLDSAACWRKIWQRILKPQNS